MKLLLHFLAILCCVVVTGTLLLWSFDGKAAVRGLWLLGALVAAVVAIGAYTFLLTVLAVRNFSRRRMAPASFLLLLAVAGGCMTALLGWIAVAFTAVSPHSVAAD